MVAEGCPSLVHGPKGIRSPAYSISAAFARLGGICGSGAACPRCLVLHNDRWEPEGAARHAAMTNSPQDGIRPS